MVCKERAPLELFKNIGCNRSFLELNLYVKKDKIHGEYGEFCLRTITFNTFISRSRRSDNIGKRKKYFRVIPNQILSTSG